MLVSLGMAVDLVLISGMITFGAKYMELAFNVDASEAGLYFGWYK